MISTEQRLGVGLAALGRPAYINVGRTGVLPGLRTADEMRERTKLVLDAAHAQGLRWVDTARSYGSAEEFLAGWLAERGHEDVTVSSKWGYAYVAQWRIETEVHEVKEHSVERLRAQWAETRKLLGDRVHLYQVHSLTADSPLFDDLELQHELARIRDSGVRLGFSTSGAAQAEAIERGWELEVGGTQLFGAVQSTWNSMEPSAGRALAEAHHGGWRVLVKETLANGRLAVEPPEAVLKVAQRHGVGPDAVALAHVLAQPWADVVLIGPASVEQLMSNLAVRDVVLSRQDLDELAPVTRDAATYWGERAALPWH
ncbi:aryl-alcohol dehydrogenase-like predicted oxidoreductase [Saccharopolyspora erythraea NRRL 2338]|uniref:Aldo/keto reductase n=2 Tax=Saccharopolyspora erythraea TaxID=1836 RepID=A4FBX7_SACEN|nr:aldo/keto reductase [Saccharopolyspora erythraea]EQD82671.1 aldo/keto reductase [Saccharopolyspora erythraea D]PFG95324.1 aryl-alcohol dehydrogenase-like predicted oxidoreductase [Saccharopolyspora erythraea NRRL 2338]QRK91968.1 aldo/keto reductase [Saccharopolyspora erythraea]CAM01552.1 aldo/keto reductase [Saccharopolyspora erythraea NRRL 2338]